MNAQEIMSSFENAGVLREVAEVPLVMPNGIEVPNKKAIIYKDDASYISTVGKNYKVIQNEEVFQKLSSALIESQLDLDGFKIDSMGSSTNARSLMTMTLPEHKVETRPGDETHMQLLARNSYDGTWKFQLDVGGFRMACTNGQVIGDYLKAYANRHTNGFSFEGMLDRLLTMTDEFANMGHKWAQMKGIKMNKDQAIDMLLDYMGYKLKGDKDKRNALLESERATSVQSIMKLRKEYTKELGSNMFAMYNVMTDHASHINEDASSRADVKDYRQKQLLKTLATWEPQLINA